MFYFIRLLIIILFFTFNTFNIFAARSKFRLIVKEDLKVYKSNSTSSKKVSILIKGDDVPCEKEDPLSTFLKVKVTYDNKRQWAYIDKNQIKYSKVVRNGVSEKYKNKFQLKDSIGIGFEIGSQLPFEKEISYLNNDFIVELNPIPNLNNYFISYYKKFNEKFGLEAALNYSNYTYEGELTDSFNQTYAIEEFVNILSVSLRAKYYPNYLGYFWLAPKLTLGYVLDDETKIDATTTELSEGKIEGIYADFKGELGYDIKLTDQFYIPLSLGISWSYLSIVTFFGYSLSAQLQYQF